MFCKASKTIRWALAGVALAGVGSAAMADVVVTASSGAAARQYPRGTRLADGQAVVLSRGDVVRVITPSGTRRWQGPGRFTAESGRQLASGVGTSSNNIRAGAIRGGEFPYPSVWDIDVGGQSGPFCYAPDVPVALWRADPSTAQSVTIRTPAGQSETVSIAAQSNATPWPVTLAAMSGGTYTITLQGGDPIDVTFVSLGTDSENAIDIAAALGEHDCFDQMESLVQMLNETGG